MKAVKKNNKPQKGKKRAIEKPNISCQEKDTQLIEHDAKRKKTNSQRNEKYFFDHHFVNVSNFQTNLNEIFLQQMLISKSCEVTKCDKNEVHSKGLKLRHCVSCKKDLFQPIQPTCLTKKKTSASPKISKEINQHSGVESLVNIPSHLFETEENQPDTLQYIMNCEENEVENDYSPETLTEENIENIVNWDKNECDDQIFVMKCGHGAHRKCLVESMARKYDSVMVEIDDQLKTANFDLFSSIDFNLIAKRIFRCGYSFQDEVCNESFCGAHGIKSFTKTRVKIENPTQLKECELRNLISEICLKRFPIEDKTLEETKHYATAVEFINSFSIN